MSEGHGAVAIGSGMSGDVRNVYVHDCRFTGGDQGIRIKSMRGRGGVVENIHFENIRMENLRLEAIGLNMFYGSTTIEPQTQALPILRDLTIKDITCESVGAAMVIRGLPEQHIERVTLENARLNAVEGTSCQDVDGLILNDVSGVMHKEPLFSCSNVRGLYTRDVVLEKQED